MYRMRSDNEQTDTISTRSIGMLISSLLLIVPIIIGQIAPLFR